MGHADEEVEASEGPTEQAEAARREDREIARQARALKRGQGTVYLVLIAASVLLMLLSPFFNRFLGAWQGVVVAPPEGGEVRVILPDSMVESRPVGEALAQKIRVGDYLNKETGHWNPTVVPPEALPDLDDVDDPEQQPSKVLPRLFARYMKSWRGTIVAVDSRPAKSTGDIGSKRVVNTMKIRFDQGGTEEVEIPEDLLPHARAGTRLEKRSGSWHIQVIGVAADIEVPPPPGE